MYYFHVLVQYLCIHIWESKLCLASIVKNYLILIKDWHCLLCFGLGFLSRGTIIWQLTISYSETGDFEERRYLYRVAVTSNHFNSQFFTNQKLITARDSLLRTISLSCSQTSKFTEMNCCFLNLNKKFSGAFHFMDVRQCLSFSNISSKWAARDCFHFPLPSGVR